MNVPVIRIAALGVALMLLLPVSAFAQRKLWGVTVSFTPVEQTTVYSKYLMGADDISFEAQTFRVGVSRGLTAGGDWSLLVVRRSLKEGGTIDKDGAFYTTTNDVTITGFEAERFFVAGNVKERVLFGALLAGGVGFVEGTMVDPTGQIVDAKNVLTFLNTDVKIQPLVRLEFAVGVVVARGFRIKASGGFDWPGWSASFGATYFFGDR